mmetsp:Transcript_51833/g.83658  ORF Transcript_51833/g.83658 Transcript_51833/m.83658 type:complete len:223 (-) Transcript_51833:2388-3056(-)
MHFTALQVEHRVLALEFVSTIATATSIDTLFCCQYQVPQCICVLKVFLSVLAYLDDLLGARADGSYERAQICAEDRSRRTPTIINREECFHGILLDFVSPRSQLRLVLGDRRPLAPTRLRSRQAQPRASNLYDQLLSGLPVVDDLGVDLAHLLEFRQYEIQAFEVDLIASLPLAYAGEHARTMNISRNKVEGRDNGAFFEEIGMVAYFAQLHQHVDDFQKVA